MVIKCYRSSAAEVTGVKIFSLLIAVVLLCSFRMEAIAVTKKTGIRGVWVPAPSYTTVLHSYKNVCAFVKLLDDLNFNSVYLVSYADSKTIFRSDVLSLYARYNNPGQGYMLTPYMKSYNTPVKSPTGDPVRDLIEEAHKHRIKVFFWFEYGFMADISGLKSTNPLVAANPGWVGLGNDRKPSNYNNHDYYFNAYNPEVQNYLISLIEEALKLYPDLDGIQGDDRMPAMPRNSGYDNYTIALYQSEHNGALPPDDYNEAEWVRWRLNKLNEFGLRLYSAVKAVNKKVIVSFAPNPYPWSMENLMQEWPQWCRDNICDLLAVQCYRRSADAYEATLSEVLKHVKSSRPDQIVAPGIILMEGGNLKITPQVLSEQIAVNRKLGINNEIYFYNEALNNKEIMNVFRKAYKKEVDFPGL